MADAQSTNDFGFQPAPANDDFGFKPSTPPAIPNTSGIEQTVQQNLNKPVDNEGTQQTQTDAQKLDTGLGFSATGMLRSSGDGKNDTAPLPADIRGHLVDSYKAGTAADAGDYMQSALPAVANTALNPPSAMSRLASGTIQNMIPSIMAARQAFQEPLGFNAEQMQSLGILDKPENAGQWVKQIPATALADVAGIADLVVNRVPSAMFGAVNAELAASAQQAGLTKDPDRWAAELSQLQNATMFAAGIEGHINAGHEALKPVVGDAIGKNAKDVTPQDINQTIASGFKDAAPKAQDFHDTAAIIDQNKPTSIMAAAVKDKDGNLGLGEDHTAAYEDYKNKTGKQDAALKDITEGMNEGFINKKGEFLDRDQIKEQFGIETSQELKELRTLAADNPNTLDTLHMIYKETGVRPDQVFEDSKNHPEISSDVAAGRVPSAYDHLREPEPVTAMGGSNEPPNKPPVSSAYITEHPFEEGAPHQPELSKEGASTSINPLAQIFNPAGISESSRDMATAIRQGRGPQAQVTAQIQEALQQHAKDFIDMKDSDRLAFIHYMETRSQGAELPENLKGMQAAADQIKDIYARMGEAVQQAFPDVGLRKDYFTHQFEDQKAADKFFNDWVAKQGSERSLKARSFPTLEEAIDAGLKPKTTNPLETVMSYVTNMNNLLAANKTVELAKDFGIADYFAKGQQPDGWVPLNGNFAEEGNKVLYAPEDAARVYNNDISEKASGPIGTIADAIQRTNNFASKLVLGLSGYHFTATTMASMASAVGRMTLATPIGEVIRGNKLIDSYLGRDQLPPELQKALDLAVKNNTVNIAQQDYWKAGPAKDYIDVFKNGSLGKEIQHAKETIQEHPVTGPVRVLANELGRTMDTISKPLFDYYIPRIKISANINELHDWLQKHPEATPEEQDRAAQDIGNSIDNRFGEMMRDNLFWHQLTRQTLQTALLSYSWVAGGARLLKGIPDTARTALGKIGIGDGQELSSNAKYLMGMAATYAVVNGVRTYLGTGQAPDDIKDFIYPRTGGKTPQGKPERELLPSHIGQFTNYLHEGLGELGNEMSPGLKLLYHLTTNQDFRGLPITNESNPWYSEQRWGDYLKYTLGEETPIGLKNFLQGEKKGSKISTTETLLGARQAPRFITDPKGYDAMMKHVNDSAYQRKLKSDRKMRKQYQNSLETTP